MAAPTRWAMVERRPSAPIDEVGVHGDPAAGVVAACDADHPAVRVATDVGDGDAVADVCAGGDRGVDEDGSSTVRRGAYSASTPREGLMVIGDVVVGVAERRATDGRGAGVDDAVEEPPPVQLQDAAAHEGVGGRGVGPVAAAVDDEHVQAGAGEQHRGGGTGGAGADDDDVVAATVVGHARCPFRVGVSGEARRDEVGGDEGGVATDAVDEVGVAVVLEALPEDVQAGVAA